MFPDGCNNRMFAVLYAVESQESKAKQGLIGSRIRVAQKRVTMTILELVAAYTLHN